MIKETEANWGVARENIVSEFLTKITELLSYYEILKLIQSCLDKVDEDLKDQNIPNIEAYEYKIKKNLDRHF